MIKHTGAILAFIIFCGALYSCIVPDSAIEPRQPKFPRDYSAIEHNATEDDRGELPPVDGLCEWAGVGSSPWKPYR